MLVTEMKPGDEILQQLQGDRKVFLVGCNGCASACKTGGAEHMGRLEELLRSAGKTITGSAVVDFLCDKSLVRSRLRPLAAAVMDSDCLLAATCGVGVQCVADSVLKRVRPACNTLNMGGQRGTWPGAERCAECGDCLLDYTGGICPITSCSKSMVNGPCGGTTSDGKCEVDRKRDCGWHRIYKRLQALGALDQMKRIVPPKKHNNYLPPYERMRGDKWAVDVPAQPAAEGDKK